MNPSKQNTSPLTNAVVQLNVRSGSGNVLAILGHVHRAIQNSNRPELANSFLQEALAGHNDQLVPTCRRYVDVQ